MLELDRAKATEGRGPAVEGVIIGFARRRFMAHNLFCFCAATPSMLVFTWV